MQSRLFGIWSNGPATADQVREALLARHPLKDSSVRSLLRRLETQGYLSHRLEGKAYLYQAAVPARSVAARAVRNIIERFCAGSVEQMSLRMGMAGALRPGGQEPTEEESEAENRIAMRAGVHDLLLDYHGNFPLNFFGDGDVGRLPPGLFQGDNLFAVRALGHAGILSRRDKIVARWGEVQGLARG